MSLQAALSPNQTLVAVLPPSSSSASTNNNSRWTLPLYQVSSRSLQATLTWKNETSTTTSSSLSSSTSPWQRLLFLNDDHVAGLFQHRYVVVWNVPRGIVSYSHDIQQKGNKGEEEDTTMVVLDIVSPIAISSSSSNSSAPPPSLLLCHYYTLVKKESKLYVYEYEIETGRLQRKIKCGHVDHNNNTNNSTLTGSFSIIVVMTESGNDNDAPPNGSILLASGGRQVKVFLSTGQKVGKLKLASDASGGAMTALSIIPSLAAASSSSSSNPSFVLVAIPTASGVVLSKLTLTTKESKATTPLEQVGLLPLNMDGVGSGSSGTLSPLQMWYKVNAADQKKPVDLLLLLQQAQLYQVADISAMVSSSSASTAAIQPLSKCRFESDLSAKKGDEQYVVLPFSSSSSTTSSSWHQMIAVLYHRGLGVQIKTIQLLEQVDNKGKGESTFRDKVILSWHEKDQDVVMGAEDTKHDDDDGNKKRKKQQIAANAVATTLGPGQAGYEQLSVSDRPTKQARKQQQQQPSDESKKTKADGDKEEEERDDTAAEAAAAASSLTIAERLEQLAAAAALEEDDDDDDDEEDYEGVGKDAGHTSKADAAKPAVKFQPKKATTQSLTQLLQQACSSNDDSLLELALAVRDVRIIEKSLQELAQQQQQQQQQADEEAGEEGNNNNNNNNGAAAIKWMDVLLTRLITRLANKPQRAEDLSVWIQCWLQQQQKQQEHASWQNAQGLLQPLRNLLQERVQTFSLWLQLEGRLSMMKS